MASRKGCVEEASLDVKMALQLGYQLGLQDHELEDYAYQPAASRNSAGAGSRMLAACSRLLGRSKESPAGSSKKKPTKSEHLIDEDDLIDKKLRARSTSSLANNRLQQHFLQQHFADQAQAGHCQHVLKQGNVGHTLLTTRHSVSLAARLSSHSSSPGSQQGSVGRGGATSHAQSATTQGSKASRPGNSRRHSMLSVSSTSTLDVEPSSQSFSNLLAHLTRAGSPLPQMSPPAVCHHRHVSSPAASQNTTGSSPGAHPFMNQHPKVQDNDSSHNDTINGCSLVQLKPVVGMSLSSPPAQQGFSFAAAHSSANNRDHGSPTTSKISTTAADARHGYDRQISLSFSPLSAAQDDDEHDGGNDKTADDVHSLHDLTLSPPPHVCKKEKLLLSPAPIPKPKDSFEEDDMMVTRSTSSYSSLVAFLASPGSRPDLM